MLSNNPVLPNFLKTVLMIAAASMSVSAFAGHHETKEAEMAAEQKIGDLKDMGSEATIEAEAMTDGADTMADKADAMTDEAEAKMDDAVDSLTPEN